MTSVYLTNNKFFFFWHIRLDPKVNVNTQKVSSAYGRAVLYLTQQQAKNNEIKCKGLPLQNRSMRTAREPTSYSTSIHSSLDVLTMMMNYKNEGVVIQLPPNLQKAFSNSKYGSD